MQASRLVGPSWPLDRWIAVNPMLGLIDLGFENAVDQAGRWLGASVYPDLGVLRRALADGSIDEGDVSAAAGPDLTREAGDLLTALRSPSAAASAPKPPRIAPRTAAERHDAAFGTAVAAELDRRVARWLAQLLDVAHGPRPGGGHDGPLFSRWIELARHDRWLQRVAGRDRMADLVGWPHEADAAVVHALQRLEIPEEERADELRGQLARLPGWSGLARWCDEWAAGDALGSRFGVLDLLALRLTSEALVLGQHPKTAARSDARPDEPLQGGFGALGLLALEHGYRRTLLDMLDRPAPPTAAPDAQVVFCIDARSEGLRRQLEASGPYETLGFAGFFAAPIRYRSLGAAESVASAPVLVRPEVEVAEQPAPGAEQAFHRLAEQLVARSAASDVTGTMAHEPAAMFPAAEAGGWILGPRALLRTLRPRTRRTTAVEAALTQIDLHPSEEDGFSADEKALVAETALRTMGLTHGFAPVVVFCGHGATTTANPHAASLNCGACGGNRGGPNARTLAAILNDSEVRAELMGRGIIIPGPTWFAAAEHDTTLDTVQLLDRHLAPPEAAARLAVLEAQLEVSGSQNADERLLRLPDTGRRRSGRAEASRRAGDWAQTRPEWGLARNAAFIVAPRVLTRGLDLDGRAFLHSYDPDGDQDGAALETILTAPMVVAHWINSQYYFSSVDPVVFGAGDKTLHNPVAGLGVLSGGDGDLRVGLPWQSVGVGSDLFHVPVRLLTVVQAPRDRVDAVIARNPVLGELFGGSWVHLVAGEGPHDWRRWQHTGWTAPVENADKKVPVS